MKQPTSVVVALLGLLAASRASAGSICVSTGDCCSFSPADAQSPCCGSSLTGADAISCGADGLCYRGSTPCSSSIDDPLCNIIPVATASTTSQGDPFDAWRACRQDTLKLNSLQRADLYGGEPILDAALQGRPDAIELLLHEGISVNTRGQGGATVLHMAALTSQGTGVVQQLLAHGSSVNEMDTFGFTPLHRAIQSQSLEAATMLLFSGANLTLAAPGGETPLHLAAYENSRELAQLLLAFGANPFARNDRGATSFELGLFDMSVPPHHMT
ncbi:hypothetical protein Gpo141_00002578 [Globisporangium polare]